MPSKTSVSHSIEEIKKPIAAHMKEFEVRFREAMRSDAPLLDKIMHYIVKRKGKQIRPMFVFFAAGINGTINDSTYRGASLIELLHTATLVHDDVVDDSNMRRGFFSVNALWKNKIAVLVGDYLLSRGLLLSVDHEEYKLLQIVSGAVREMSEGELLQIEKARKLDITEDVYFDIIQRKTASLIASCCAVGAASAGASEEQIKKMHRFGQLIGIAFQIKDDLFDYQIHNKTGKPSGIDIKESKMTLPLIHALSVSSRSESRSIIKLIKGNGGPEAVNKVLTFVKEKNGIEYATTKMKSFRDDALLMLNDFPDSDMSRSLAGLVNFTIERES